MSKHSKFARLNPVDSTSYQMFIGIWWYPVHFNRLSQRFDTYVCKKNIVLEQFLTNYTYIYEK